MGWAGCQKSRKDWFTQMTKPSVTFGNHLILCHFQHNLFNTFSPRLHLGLETAQNFVKYMYLPSKVYCAVKETRIKGQLSLIQKRK